MYETDGVNRPLLADRGCAGAAQILGMAQAMAATALAQAVTSAIVFASGEGRGAALIWVFVAM